MTKYYHVDMHNKLQEGMSIKLNGKELSHFGKIYAVKFNSLGLDNFDLNDLRVKLLSKEAYREYFLETFRRQDPQLKNIISTSRLNSFFALRAIDDCKRLIERFDYKGKFKIFEVESDSKAFEYDMSWLDFQFPRDPKSFGYYYRAYWKGEKLDNNIYLSEGKKLRPTLIEVLLQGDIQIREEISIE